ncbi:putative ADP-sugar pyrophosphatase [Paratrimastix pyriformis]|uniref:ADP-sugar pyrophosphatase n=1 Tax=Paratrimastix pyriformis TaxID=342808 RepID=A0ABQ8UQL0_9EUKA|nr:putative ADP-sugar pyrophosphatase [Paratrimastix pyriformis]
MPKQIGVEIVAEGRWLNFAKAKWVNALGETREWEMIQRKMPRGGLNVVEVVPILRLRGQPPQIVLVSQYRVPVDHETLELPAGLVDGEQTAEQTARRELWEETGYTCGAMTLSPMLTLNPAIAETTSKMVTVEIDGDHPDNEDPHPHNAVAEGERTTVHLLPLDQHLPQRLQEMGASGELLIEARLYAFAQGIALAHTLGIAAPVAPHSL